MRNLRPAAALAALAIAFQMAPTAAAKPLDGETRFTFSAPVEIAGTVLPAGEYVFRLLYPESSRVAVAISSARGNRRIMVLFGIVDYRYERSTESLILEAHANGAAPTVRSWFPAGGAEGVRFREAHSTNPIVVARGSTALPTAQ